MALHHCELCGEAPPAPLVEAPEGVYCQPCAEAWAAADEQRLA